ncbi:MAG: type II secretion system GspH family protein [Candidatus Nomurabacteria bacterium]|jgi:prepilin-type N-terminal cleavage/methylation domain-containing protein|nr:type II secretion system GspH family protein [Candidatus Nomurabacteria bacterium]
MKKGFTILELAVVIVVFSLATVLFFFQKADYDAAKRDEQRKVAINAMFYNLEEGFYSENNYYPETINEDNLKAMDPQLFTDPFGTNLGDDSANYRYEPVDCKDQKCASYTLRASMEREDDFIKKSRH